MSQDKTPATVSAAQGQETQIDPANTLTDKDGQTTSAQVEQQDGDADEGPRTCPICGGWCQRLPEGQPRPTPEQLFQSCWVDAGGWEVYCSDHLRLEAALARSAMRPEKDLPRPYELLQVDVVRPLLHLACRHPLVSDQLTLLLVDWLRSVEVYPNYCEDRDLRTQVTVGLRFHGNGVPEAIRQRHHAEMLALLKALLPRLSSGCLYAEKWTPDAVGCGGEWGSLNSVARRVTGVVLDSGVSDDAWVIPWPPEDPEQGGQG